jgi:IS30 family transposase
VKSASRMAAWLPKTETTVGEGTNLNTYRIAELRAIDERINTIPRRSLHWSTTNTIYN